MKIVLYTLTKFLPTQMEKVNMILDALLAAEAEVEVPLEIRPNMKPLYLFQKQVNETSFLRTLQRVKKDHDKYELFLPTNYLQAVAQIVLRNPYGRGIYKVIRRKLEDYVDERESNDLALSSMSLVPLFEDHFGKKRNFLRTYYLSSLTKDLTVSKNWDWYRCYYGPSESFHLDFENKKLTCGPCYLEDNPGGLYDEYWNPKENVISHFVTRKKFKNTCHRCEAKVARFKFVRDCFDCRYEIFTNKLELLEKGYLISCVWTNWKALLSEEYCRLVDLGTI